MESLTFFHPLIEVNLEEMSNVRKSLDLEEEKIQQSIDSIIEWWKKQEHLAEVLPIITRSIIERLIIFSGGSIETSKRKIEKLLTMRGLMPELVLNKSFEEFEDLFNNSFVFPLPKINPLDNSRIIFMSFLTESYRNFNFLTLMRSLFLIAEFRTCFDYNFSDRYIIDFKYFKASMITKINPIIMKKCEVLVTEGYEVKLKGIHILNAPTFIDKIVFIFKQVLKEKLAKRVYVHKSYDELYELVGKEVLPEDYGGDCQSCQKLSEQWRHYFKTEQAKNILAMSNKMCSNESKRSSIKFNEEYLGMPGSFKQLNVD